MFAAEGYAMYHFSTVGCILHYTCIVFNPDVIPRFILQYQRRTDISVVVLYVEAGARYVYLIYNRINLRTLNNIYGRAPHDTFFKKLLNYMKKALQRRTTAKYTFLNI